MKVERRQVGWVFLLWWVLASAAGWMLSPILFAILMPKAPGQLRQLRASFKCKPHEPAKK